MLHMARVELISNVQHYYYTALALDRIGYLQQYITGPSARSDDAWMRRCGKLFERLWDERRLDGVPPEAHQRVWLHEILQKVILRLTQSTASANNACNEYFARRAAQKMRECDVLHFVHSVGWIAARKARRLGAKVICDMREEHPQFQKDILAEEADLLGIDMAGRNSGSSHHILEEIGLADYIFCPSAYAKRTFVQRGISESKLIVCPYGVDRTRFSPGKRVPRQEFRVLFLGQVCLRKGVHYLLEGFRKAQLPHGRLVLAGPVDPAFRVVLDRYAGLFEETGSIPRGEVPAQHLAADVFVIPSLADAYPLVVAEAMSCGVPVVVSENTGWADLIENGREGFVVPIRDSDAIAERLTYLYEHREACVAMGARASLAIRGRDWNNYQISCAKFYRSLFGDERPDETMTSARASAGRAQSDAVAML